MSMRRVGGKSVTKPEWQDISKYGVYRMSRGRETLSVHYRRKPPSKPLPLSSG